MLQNTVFAVLYILRVFCSKKREAHQRFVSLCQANCNPTLFLGVCGFATQHSFYGFGLCDPTLLLGLRVLQPNTPFKGLRFCKPTLFSVLQFRLLQLRAFKPTLKVLQPNTPFRGLGFCKPTLLLGLRVFKPTLLLVF